MYLPSPASGKGQGGGKACINVLIARSPDLSPHAWSRSVVQSVDVSGASPNSSANRPF